MIRIVKLPVAPLKLDEFMNHFNHSKEKIRSFDGCCHLKLLCDVKEKNIVYTYSEWESENHLEKYLHSELFKSTWAQVRPLFFERPQAWSLNELITIESSSKS